jgi:hypothetical protein
MTKKEIDEYLISIGGLESGYRINMPPITDAYAFDIQPGWYPLIKELIEDLISLGWNKQILQVKEKFGGLRFYINEGTDEIHNRIIEAERKSYTICEITGKPGELRKDIGWYRTLCGEEYLKYKQKYEH